MNIGAFAIAGMLLLASCANTAHIEKTNGADLSRYKTYSWVEEGQQQGKSGGGSKGIDSDTVKRLHRGGPTSPWSHLRDKDRDPVFNAIKEKYPARYQQLIEQYYKSFSDENDG